MQKRAEDRCAGQQLRLFGAVNKSDTQTSYFLLQRLRRTAAGHTQGYAKRQAPPFGKGPASWHFYWGSGLLWAWAHARAASRICVRTLCGWTYFHLPPKAHHPAEERRTDNNVGVKVEMSVRLLHKDGASAKTLPHGVLHRIGAAQCHPDFLAAKHLEAAAQVLGKVKGCKLLLAPPRLRQAGHRLHAVHPVVADAVGGGLTW